MALVLATVVAASREFVVHNAHNVTVSKVFLVHSAHTDLGCKTFGCSAHLAAGEPNLCQGNHVEPYAYHIINRWFDEFLLRAVAYANATRELGDARYRHMVQPYIISLFLDCAASGLTSWPGSGWSKTDMPLLHCPNASTIAEVRGALKRGDLFVHGFPHNAEPAAFPDASLFDAALAMPQAIAAEIGVPAPTAVSQRDVPGWTRATIPLLAKRGINGLSIGAGQPPGKPDTPPLFVWKDEASGTDVVVSYESSYGYATTSTRHQAVAFVLPNGVAMAAGWFGDNSGPPEVNATQEDFTSLRALFPNATVISGTFDDFFAVANQPEVKARLPVVTADIGDGWVYGVPSDPLKNALLREAARQRRECMEGGECDPSSPAMRAFDRLLMKVPEHTWGIASQIFMADYTNYTNAQFDAVRSAQQPTGFLHAGGQADFNTTVNSWVEQRAFVVNAPRTLARHHPSLAQAMETAFCKLRNVRANMPSTAHLHPAADPVAETFLCGGRTAVGFDHRGALSTLNTSDGTAWASASHPVGLYQYLTFDNEDYNLFLQDFASRVAGPGCGHYAPGYRYGYGSADDADCKNFRKPNVSSARPTHRVFTPSLTKLWHGASAGGCEFVAEMTMDTAAHKLAGAPEKLVVAVNVSERAVKWDVVQLNKRPTRLPEAGFFSFEPAAAAAAPEGWELHILVVRGSRLSPTDVLGSGPGGAAANASVYGGSPHLRGVEAVTWTPQTKPSPAAAAAAVAAGAAAAANRKARGDFALTISSLDVPIVCTGAMTPFPSPRTASPDMARGVHFNIFQNIWNTNYVLFYPFDPEDAYVLSRFELAFS